MTTSEASRLFDFHFLEKLSSSKSRSTRLRHLVEKSGFFDHEWYLLEYYDIAKAGVDPLWHFCKHGDREGRSPGPRFNSRAYLDAWPDVATSDKGPLEHFLRIGHRAGRQAPGFPEDVVKRTEFRSAIYRSGLFDESWYRAHNPDLRAPEIDLLSHFVFFGAREGRDPGPNFSSILYTMAYSEEMEENEIPLEHFLRKGRSQGLVAPGASNYELWLNAFDRIGVEDRELMRRCAAKSSFPAVEIIHVFDSLACREADAVFAALREQALDAWTALILFADDVSEDDRAAVAACADGDSRLRVVTDAERDIRDIVTKDYVLLTYGCSRLTPHATYLFMEAALSKRAEFVYSDHDHWADDGSRRDPVFKPIFSPEYLRNHFYIGPSVLVHATPKRRDFVTRVIDDFRAHRCSELSQELLGATRETVAHVPFALYSISSDSRELTPGADLSAATIVEQQWPSVSIVIPTRDRIELLRDCLDSIEQQTQYPREQLEIVVVDNGSVTEEAALYFVELRSRAGYKVVVDSGDFNFARLNNFGARESSGDVLILLNNDMTVIEPRWVELIVAQCLQQDVGAVGAKLLYPDGTIQHAGCNIGVAGVAAHRYVGRTAESVAKVDVTRELAAVTGACLGIRRDIYVAVGGLDETLRVAFNDTRLCLACLERGLRNVYIAEPLLYHFESKSRGFDVSQKQVEQRNREAIYTRQRSRVLFQNDPYYSPNLSIDRIDELAAPPRFIKPWRRPSKDRPGRIMLLSSTHAVGSGVALVLQTQARRLIREGFEVIIGGPRSETELAYDGCRRMAIRSPVEASMAAVRENVDCIIAHTPPFFSVTRHLGAWPIVYFFDHGEPNPEFFADRASRETVNWEKRFCAPLAKRIFAISQTIREQSLYEDVTVLRNGNSHMATWSPKWAEVRSATRTEFGWDNKFVVLNVCRFGVEERLYKGIDKFVEVAEEFWFSRPDAHGKIVFALAGKARPEDVAEMRSKGLEVFPNVSDQLMSELFAASDLYMNFSKWEGYNLGIGQALAMGLPVIASDIAAHREFPITVTNNVVTAVESLHEHFMSARRSEAQRRAITFDWDIPTGALVELIRGDLYGQFPA